MTTDTDRRRFGIYPCGDSGRGILTAEASYADGYASGLTWGLDRTTPGGPMAYRAYAREDDPDWRAFCAATSENHDAWMAGWRDGRAAAAAKETK